MARSQRVQRFLQQARSEAAKAGGRTAVSSLVHGCRDSLRLDGAAVVSMTGRGQSAVVAATGASAVMVEELQFNLGEGPCIDASREGRPMLLPELARSGPSRWPGFTGPALEAGVGALFAFPLQVGAVRLGVLDLCRERTGMLAAGELSEALDFADAAVVLLLELQASADAGQLHPDVSAAMEDRAMVHQATGMVSVQLNVSLGEALLLLRGQAFATERSVVNLASDVVNRVIRFDAGP